MNKRKNMITDLMRVIFLLAMVIIVATSKPCLAKTKKTKKLDFNKAKYTYYAKDNIIVYAKPESNSEKIGTFVKGDKVKVKGISENKKWCKIKYKFKTRYIKYNKSLSTKKTKKLWAGTKLNSHNGRVKSPSGGSETYYNMNMNNVVSIMRSKGYSAKKYPYWVRDDGVKMLGKYIMVGANLRKHPKGSIVKTTLGMAIVCDTGGFARRHPYDLDIAVTW